MISHDIPDFKQWHEVYLSLSPYGVPWDVSALARYENLWGRTKPPPTIEDLKLVIRFIVSQVRFGKRKRESFRLYNLLDPDRFMYDLTDARHAKSSAERTAPRTERTKILEAVGRQEHAPKEAEHVSSIVWAEWEKMKASLK